MATSGSWDYGRTAAQLIQAALENIGVYSVGETLASADETMALARLNMMVKAMSGRIDMAPGLKIHTRQRITLFLAVGQQTYLVGPASTDARATTQFGRTTLSAAEAVSQTTLSITSNTDTTTYPGTTVTMTASDIVGIELNDGTIQWTTISGTPSTTMDIAVALTGAAAAGNYVWWFTSRAQRFVELEAATLMDENYNETPLGIFREVAAYQYGVTDKYADGDPTAILVEPLRITTKVTLNSQPTDVTKVIQLTCLYPAEDYDATTNDIAFPQEYFDFLSWELGLRCAPAFGKEFTQTMKDNLVEARTYAKNLNPETTDLYFQCGSSE